MKQVFCSTGMPQLLLTDKHPCPGNTCTEADENSTGAQEGRGCILRSDDTRFVIPSVILNKSTLYTSLYIDTEDFTVTI